MIIDCCCRLLIVSDELDRAADKVAAIGTLHVKRQQLFQLRTKDAPPTGFQLSA